MNTIFTVLAIGIFSALLAIVTTAPELVAAFFHLGFGV